MRLTCDRPNGAEANPAEDNFGDEWQKNDAGDYARCDSEYGWGDGLSKTLSPNKHRW
jgi:hypothetical protein